MTEPAAVRGIPFALPPVPDHPGTPVWTGGGFLVGGQLRRILAYGSHPSGWTDHLTDLHEATAGDTHFIDVASRAHAIAEIERTKRGQGGVVLEVGISSGYLVEALARRLPGAAIVGADYTYGTLEKAVARVPSDVPLLQFDLVECPLPDSSVDVVVLLNVLEHIERDTLALAQVQRILKPGGVAIIEVPAGSHLYDSYDKALMHWRRYDMPGLERLVRGAGLTVERRSHLGFFVYPGFAAAKRARRARPATEEKLDLHVRTSIRQSKRLGGLASRLMAAEAVLRRRMYLPWGIRCLVTARKAPA